MTGVKIKALPGGARTLAGENVVAHGDPERDGLRAAVEVTH